MSPQHSYPADETCRGRRPPFLITMRFQVFRVGTRERAPSKHSLGKRIVGLPSSVDLSFIIPVRRGSQSCDLEWYKQERRRMGVRGRPPTAWLTQVFPSRLTVRKKPSDHSLVLLIFAQWTRHEGSCRTVRAPKGKQEKHYACSCPD